MTTGNEKNEGHRFEFLGCLGSGGFGEVYLARMTTESGLERKVAVKLLHGSVDESAVRRLRDEARLLAALNHRAILQVHDLVEVANRTALVTEYVEGEDLGGLLGAGVEIPPRCAVGIVGEVAGALNGALTSPAPGSGEPIGLVHSDIKPGNIRIARPRTATLLLMVGVILANLPRVLPNVYSHHRWRAMGNRAQHRLGYALWSGKDDKTT